MSTYTRPLSGEQEPSIEQPGQQTQVAGRWCIPDYFAEQVHQRPHAIAVQCGGKRLTYAELEQRSNQLANYLQGLGVETDSYVSILVGRSVELIVGLLGILKAGAAYAPLDPSYPQKRLSFMLEDTQSSVLLTQGGRRSVPSTYRGTVVAIDDDWNSITEESDAAPSAGIGLESLAYVNYTSGSTGIPKVSRSSTRE